MTGDQRPDLTVGISTTQERLPQALKCILAPVPGIDYLLVVQSPQTQDLRGVITDITQRPDIRVVAQPETGVAKSRNAVITQAAGHFTWFADDDLIFDESLYRRIITAMRAHPECQAITFASQDANGQPRKRFPKRFKYLSLFSTAKYATFEIAIQTDALRESKTRFDPNFGAGAPYPFGDEYIFLADMLRSGAKIAHVPIEGACHPATSSAFRHFIIRNETERRILMRVFGRWVGQVIYCAFWMRKAFRRN